MFWESRTMDLNERDLLIEIHTDVRIIKDTLHGTLHEDGLVKRVGSLEATREQVKGVVRLTGWLVTAGGVAWGVVKSTGHWLNH